MPERDLLVGRAALVLVDVQKGGDGAIPHMEGAAERAVRLGRTLRVLEAARAARLPVIFFREAHRRDLVDFGRELDGAEAVHLLEGDRSSELVDELAPREDDNEYVITKRRYSCFFGTDLLILLRGLRVETLVLLGGLTDVCVHYTFVDAHQHDYVTRVIEDCCGGSSQARHAAALDAMEYLQHGALRASDEVCAAFAALAEVAAR
jgi:nicotinamidase-related amidase